MTVHHSKKDYSQVENTEGSRVDVPENSPQGQTVQCWETVKPPKPQLKLSQLA